MSSLFAGQRSLIEESLMLEPHILLYICIYICACLPKLLLTSHLNPRLLFLSSQGYNWKKVTGRGTDLVLFLPFLGMAVNSIIFCLIPSPPLSLSNSWYSTQTWGMGMLRMRKKRKENEAKNENWIKCNTYKWLNTDQKSHLWSVKL